MDLQSSKMQFTFLILLSCVSVGLSSEMNEQTEFKSLIRDIIKVTIYGGPIDDIAYRLLRSMKTSIDHVNFNNILDIPLDSNTTDKLEKATESIADGIDSILEEMNPFQQFPALQEFYDFKVRTAMRLLLSEAAKKLVQLSKIQLY